MVKYVLPRPPCVQNVAKCVLPRSWPVESVVKYVLPRSPCAQSVVKYVLPRFWLVEMRVIYVTFVTFWVKKCIWLQTSA